LGACSQIWGVLGAVRECKILSDCNATPIRQKRPNFTISYICPSKCRLLPSASRGACPPSPPLPATTAIALELLLLVRITLYDEIVTCLTFHYAYLHRVSKNFANLFLSERRHISTNFDNFWQKDGKEAKIIRGALIFHLI